MKELIEFIAKSLVENPDQVEVNEVRGNKTTIIELRVAQEDMGKIIGRHGKTVRCLRTLLNTMTAKLEMRAVLEVLE